MKYIRKVGQLTPNGDSTNWSRFLFTPVDGQPAVHLWMKPGADAFLLHGIIHLQPQVDATLETMVHDDGHIHASAFIEISPAFSWEFEFPGSSKSVQTQVSRDKLTPTTNQSSECPIFGSGRQKTSMGPQAVKNHHPMYHLVAKIEDGTQPN